MNAEHQKKIDELNQLNRDMHHLLQGTDVGVIFLDRELRIRKFTPRIDRTFSMRSSDIGQAITEVSHRICFVELECALKRVITQQAPFETDVRDDDGNTYLLRILPYVSEETVDGVVMMMIDISALEETRRNLTQLSSIVEYSGDAILATTPDGVITAWNHGAEDLFGYTEKEAIGQSMDLVVPEERREELATERRRIIDGELSREITTVRKDKNGRRVDVAVRLSPMRDACGHVVGISAIDRDITDIVAAQNELRESEHRFRGTFENAAVGMAHVDLNGRLLRVNQRLCEIVGYPREELLQKSVQTITHADDRATDMEIVSALHHGKIDTYSREKRYVRKNGTVVWIYVTVSLQRDEWGKPLYCIAIIVDISKRKQFEEALRRAVQQRDQFLAMLSHELRNPLAAVRNAIRLLEREDASTETHAEARQVVKRQTDLMTRLLDELLDVSRITQNKITLRKRVINLTDVVLEAVDSAQASARERRISVGLEVEQESLFVFGDPARLQQVVANLLTNAVKYSAAEKRILVRLARDDRQAVLRVEDQGIGIEPELISRIFDLFVQSDETLARSEGGMGVGLALVKSLVEMHGGSVSAHSTGRGCGSQFVVCLPLSQHLVDRPSMGALSHTHAKSAMSILLVEDNADSRGMLKSLLELDGHQVTVAEDGREGLEAILRERPKVALVDIGLPGMDGYAVAREVRKQLKVVEVYLVALTGYGREKDRQKAFSAGFDEHLVKPVHPDDLGRVLGRAQLRTELRRVSVIDTLGVLSCHTPRGDSFNPQPSGEDRFWIGLSLAVTSKNVRLPAHGVSLRLNEPRLTAAG